MQHFFVAHIFPDPRGFFLYLGKFRLFFYSGMIQSHWNWWQNSHQPPKAGSFCSNRVKEWNQWYWMLRWCCLSWGTGWKPQACFTHPSNNLQTQIAVNCYHCQFRFKWFCIPLLINCLPPPSPPVNESVFISLKRLRYPRNSTLVVSQPPHPDLKTG